MTLLRSCTLALLALCALQSPVVARALPETAATAHADDSQLKQERVLRMLLSEGEPVPKLSSGRGISGDASVTLLHVSKAWHRGGTRPLPRHKQHSRRAHDVPKWSGTSGLRRSNGRRRGWIFRG